MRGHQKAKVLPTADDDPFDSSTRVIGRPPKPGFVDLDDEDVDGFITTYVDTHVTAFSPRQDWNDIEATLSKRLALNLDGGSGDPSRTSGRTNRIGQDEVNEEDDDDVVDGFLSESPEYQQMNLEKKIERYATQLQEMKSRMAKWQARRTAYQDCIKQLETRLKDQAAAFAEQEDAWEKEAMAMSSQFQRTPNKFQNTVVHNAGRDELERQRNKEALRQMIHGAADFEDEGAGDDL
ncbi:hypothetical protein AaE_002517, partial [Aphanomyces astaci]